MQGRDERKEAKNNHIFREYNFSTYFWRKTMQNNVADARPDVLAGLCEFKRIVIATIAIGSVTVKRLKMASRIEWFQ